jgi:hypothetical protein
VLSAAAAVAIDSAPSRSTTATTPIGSHALLQERRRDAPEVDGEAGWQAWWPAGVQASAGPLTSSAMRAPERAVDPVIERVASFKSSSGKSRLRANGKTDHSSR